jgi:hypothetical protein
MTEPLDSACSDKAKNNIDTIVSLAMTKDAKRGVHRPWCAKLAPPVYRAMRCNCGAE